MLEAEGALYTEEAGSDGDGANDEDGAFEKVTTWEPFLAGAEVRVPIRVASSVSPEAEALRVIDC